MPRSKRKEPDIPSHNYGVNRMLPQNVTLVKRSDGIGQSGGSSFPSAGAPDATSGHSGDWPTLNLSGSAMSGGEWDGHPFQPSGMSSGHSQTSSGNRRYADGGAEGPDWHHFMYRLRAPSSGGQGLGLAGVGGHASTDEEEDDADEWDGSVPSFEVASSTYSRPLSVLRAATNSDSQAASENAHEDSAASGSGALAEPPNPTGERFLAQLPPTLSRRLRFIDTRGQFLGLPGAGAPLSVSSDPGTGAKGPATSLASFLRPDGVNYLVVGVLGASGVGKSTLLNWLVNGALPAATAPTPSPAPGAAGSLSAKPGSTGGPPSSGDAEFEPEPGQAEFGENGHLDFQEDESRADSEEAPAGGHPSSSNNNNSSGVFAGAQGGAGCCFGDTALEDWERPLRGTLRGPVFPTQTIANQLACQAQTQGVDVFVTAMERLILLDTQPINSTSVCADLTPTKSSTSGSSSGTGANDEASGTGALVHGSETTSLRVAAYLLSVCHAVLVVSEDSPVDAELLNFIHTAAMLKPSILVGGSPGTGSSAASNSSGTAATTATAAAKTRPARGKPDGGTTEEEKEEEEEEDEEAGEEEGDKTAERKVRRKRVDAAAAQSDYMAHVFWVVNKVENCHQWYNGRAAQDWTRLIDGLFKLRPPTEVSVPPPAASATGDGARTPASKEGSHEANAAEEGAEEAADGAREGARSRSESGTPGPKSGSRADAVSTPKSQKEGKRRKEELAQGPGSANGAGLDESARSADSGKEGERRARVFCLPLVLPADERMELEPAFESYKWLEEEFDENARVLMRELLALPRHHMQSPQAAFTERKWLKFCKDLWEGIGTSPLFADYSGLIV